MDQVPVREMSAPEAAWLAAAIDGEGSFGVYKARKGRRPTIQIANTVVQFVERAREVVGPGWIVTTGPRPHDSSHLGRKVIHSYRLEGSVRCAAVLRQVLPYLIIKKAKAEAFLSEVTTEPFGGKHNGLPDERARVSEWDRSTWKDPAMRAKRIEGIRRAKRGVVS